MTVTTTIGYVLAGLLAAGIIFIGIRFLVALRVAAAGYGVLSELDQSSARAYERQGRPRHRYGAVRHHPDARGCDAPPRMRDVGRDHHSDR